MSLEPPGKVSEALREGRRARWKGCLNLINERIDIYINPYIPFTFTNVSLKIQFKWGIKLKKLNN